VTPDIEKEDARALLDAAARFVQLSAARQEQEGRVVRLARRLTRDWKLTDAEAIRVAGELALRLLSGKKDEHGG